MVNVALTFVNNEREIQLKILQGQRIMGFQQEFTANDVNTVELNVAAKPSETISYITDLLVELQEMASLSGLMDISNGIASVLADHEVASAHQ